MKGKSTMISLDKEQIDTLKKAKVVIDFILEHGFGWDDIHDFYEMCWRNGVPIKLVQSSCNYQRKHLFADDKKKNELF